jgi:outer membrane protein OmpA-like peptidoglycan-associated protein|tara:strand:+ start:418 stop:1773 length:1356 start_codon:yes stop_codon:yes gene_type:complete
MKHLKLAIIALFTLAIVGSANAQDANNPWVVGFGINSVDIQNGKFGSEEFFKDAFDTSDLNILPSISRISAEKYLEKGFTLQLAGTLNKVTYVNMTDDSDYIYFSVGALVKYDLNHLFGETGWFDPYVGIGGDFVDADDKSELMATGAVGFNVWFNENLGLNFQHGWKKGFNNNIANHFQSTAGLVIKFGGKDTDGDGVYDKFDACPEIAGLVAFKGCPDSDGDGIKDSDDACPNVAGLATMNGCPDADADGIADKDDMCPNAKGTKANKGCPDTDGDGVVDKNDKCPTAAGPVANGGCAWPDTDGDSILDKDDKCPNVAGVASEGGCPEIISNEAQMGMNSFAQAILFKLESASFESGVTDMIDGMLAIMNEYPQAEFAIKGFTDNSGSVSGNLKLSNSRANAVKDYLIANGIPAARLTAVGFGQDSPIASNKTRAGRVQNRRVEVKVTN